MNLRAVLVLLAVLVVALRLLLARQKRAHVLAATTAARGHRCPECGARRVVAGKGLTLPPDAAGNSFELKAIACRACTFRGLAVYRGPAAPRGHRLDWQEHAALTLAIDRCPSPTDPACECPAHQRYGASAEATRDPVGFDLD